MRKYVSVFEVSIGPVNLVGALYGVKATGTSDENSFVSVCPDCTDTPVKPKQTYICDDGHSHPIGELLKARADDDGTLAFVDSEEVKAARTSDLPLNVMRCTVHPAEVVEAATFPSDSAYVLVPRNRDEFYDLAVTMVAHSDKAFVAQCNVRNHEGFYRLTNWRGSLVIQRLYWPSEVNIFDAHDVEVKKDVYNAALGMVERIEQEFDPYNYIATTKSKLEALTPGAAPAAKASKSATAAQSADLLSMLSSFESDDKPAKKAKKSA